MKLKEKSAFLYKLLSLLSQTWFLCGFVLFIASIWRLTNLTLIEFKGDEALNLFLATRPLFGHPMPPASLASSVGILNFPLLNYFLFPITLISYYPPFVSFCIALLNVLAIGAFFLLLSKYFNRLTAFFTTILFSLAPWGILYSRKIWAQDFLIPLVVALLFSFFQLYKEKKQKYWLFFGMISLFLIQIHQTAGILPILLFFPLIRKTRPHIRLLLSGIGIGFLPAIPYIWYEILHACPDCIAFTLLHGKLQIYHPDLFLRIFQIITTGNFHTILGNMDNLLFTTLYPITAKLTKLSYVMYLLLPISAVVFWIRNKEYRFFVIISLTILLLFFLLKIQPEMHYFIIFLPFLFLFLGNFFSNLIQNKQLSIKIPGMLLFFLFIMIFVSFDYSFFHLLSLKKGFGGDYGGTYTIAEESAEKDLLKYKKHPSFPEMVLAYYVPKESIRGSTPVGQILYPLSELSKNLTQMNKLVQKFPDPRVVNQLVAYYTYPQNLTHNNIFYLKKHIKKFPVYVTLYQFALSDYLYTYHKHYFADSNFWIEYPEHWHENQTQNSITFSDEYVAFTLFFTPQALPQQAAQEWQQENKTFNNHKLTEYVCMQDNNWCGSIIPTIQSNGKIFSIALTLKDKTIDSTTVVNERKVLENIVDTMLPAVY